MSTAFINITANGIGSEPVAVYTEATANSASVLIGCNIANITESTLPISIILEKGFNQTYIAKNIRVQNGSVYELMKGNKLIIESGDSIIAVSNEDNAFDIILSLLTGANE